MIRFITLLALLLSCSPAHAMGALRLVINKSTRQLTLYSDALLLKTYKVALGSQPVGTKQREGDGKTPEGIYTVCVKNAKSSYYLSLGLDYPSAADAARGLKAGLITRREHDAIVDAHARHKTPSWQTALGGEIFIHGGGASSDWTLGCIALDNPEIKELFDQLPLGTVVEILP